MARLGSHPCSSSARRSAAAWARTWRSSSRAVVSRLKALDVELHATRAETDPRRFVGVRLHFAVQGAVDPAQLDRAIALSRDKYCSVWHSLRQDIALEITTSIAE